MVSRMWKVNLVGLTQELLKCSETGVACVLLPKVLMDLKCSYILHFICLFVSPAYYGTTLETHYHVDDIVCEARVPANVCKGVLIHLD